MKRSQVLRSRPPPSHCDLPSAPLRRKGTAKQQLRLPPNCRRVTLAYARRNFGAQLAGARMGLLFFDKRRGGGRESGALLSRVETEPERAGSGNPTVSSPS